LSPSALLVLFTLDLQLDVLVIDEQVVTLQCVLGPLLLGGIVLILVFVIGSMPNEDKVVIMHFQNGLVCE
jgi:hypothetical protein